MGNKDYTLILNDAILSDAIIASDKIANYDYHITNGFDGEIYNAFTSSLDVIIGILTLIMQYKDLQTNETLHNAATNTCSKEEELDDDDETFITIIGPDGFEYRNVPMCKVADLLKIIKNQY